MSNKPTSCHHGAQFPTCRLFDSRSGTTHTGHFIRSKSMRFTSVGEICLSAFWARRIKGCVDFFEIDLMRPWALKLNATSPLANGGFYPYRPPQTTLDNWAPVTTILAALFDRGFFLITISTSRSSALRKCISRSTENPSNR